MITLNVNIDHVATIRQARGGSEPDPVSAATIAEYAGASGIVAHLREDRRHIQDRDIWLLKETVQTKLDLEMAATDEIIGVALELKPELVTIVPEKRMELTTEGGLDITSKPDFYAELCRKMHSAGIEVSFFIEPEKNQIEASAKAGADMVELHTGVYANKRREKEIYHELEKLQNSAVIASSLGLKIAAGHGLNYINVKPICQIKELNELSIGHSIISRAVIIGLDRAVRDMISIMNTERAK